MTCFGLVAVGWLVWVALGWAALGVDGVAQTAPPDTLEAALHAMSDAAGVIFAGQVVGVKHAAGVVEVTFRVDRAVRGCSAGGTYVLREWEGLWAGGDARYRVGQRLMMLLRAPGAGGMSSPVGGMDGAIPILGTESEIGTGNGVNAAGASVGPVATIDLRWVGTRVARTAAAGGPSEMSTGGVNGAMARSVVESAVGLERGEQAGSDGGAASVSAQGASVDTVVGMLGAWEAARAAQ